jgi:hypothetical protein
MSICIELPQLLACLDVKERHGKENYGEEQHDQILHSTSLDSNWNPAAKFDAGAFSIFWRFKPSATQASKAVFLHKNDSDCFQV